jgi:hypothetical protein
MIWGARRRWLALRRVTGRATIFISDISSRRPEWAKAQIGTGRQTEALSCAMPAI